MQSKDSEIPLLYIYTREILAHIPGDKYKTIHLYIIYMYNSSIYCSSIYNYDEATQMSIYFKEEK